MRSSVGRGPADRGAEHDVWSWLGGALLVTVVGVVLGLQYVAPDKRMLAVLAAIVVVGVAWRLDLVSGIGLILLVLPYPRSNVYGSTNVAFILLLVILWLLRVSQGNAPRPRRTPIDAAMIALLMAFVISFYNVTMFGYALANFATLLSGVALCYLIVSNVRTSKDLARIHVFQAITAATVCLVAVYELNHPGGVLIPGWIDFHATHGEALDTRNIRVGGPFFDFELLSEFCAINSLLVLFLFLRARSGVRRLLFGGLLILVAFVQFATVTRGGIIALFLGLVYLMYLLRRRLRFVPVAMSVAGGLVLLLAMNFFVAHFTRSGDLIARVLNPATFEFEHGLPLNRADLWVSAWERMMHHPIIGWGPYYDVSRGLTFWYWPHNGYLFVGNLVGLVGLAMYLWLLYALWRTTAPTTADFDHADYATAFMVFGRVQLFVFIVDQFKIDFMRNATYTLHVFVMFGVLVATALMVRRPRAGAPDAAAAA
jgi:O-antigen ligase